MTKVVAITLALIMLTLVAWGLFFEAGATHILIDGQEITGPFKGTIGALGLVVGLVSLYCAAIFLLFVFAGIGIFILGGVIFTGLAVAGFAFPFLLVLLVPLSVLWVFIALVRGMEP